MLVVATVVKGIRAVAMETVEVVDARVLGVVGAVEAADTKEGDLAVVGGAAPLSASMVLIYQNATILPMISKKWETKDVPK